MRPLRSTVALLLLLWLGPATSQAETDPLIEAMSAEIDRAMDILAKRGGEHPYYISIEINRARRWSIRGEDGGLHSWEPSTSLRADVDVRVGSPRAT